VGTVVLCVVVFIAALLVATYFVSNAGRSLPGGYRPLMVLTGSMEPKLPVGSIILVKQVNPAEITVGDIITFREGQAPDSRLVTHRVYSLTRDELGRESIVTKGDANESPDVQPVELSQVVGKVVFASPLIGRVIRFVRTPVGLILTILLPAAVLIGWEIRDLIRRKRRASQAAGVVALVVALGITGLWYPHSISASSQMSPTGAYFSAVQTLEGTLTAGTWETPSETSLKLLPGTAKAVRPSEVPPGPACFPIASLDQATGRLTLDFGELHPGNTNNSVDVFCIKNEGSRPVEVSIFGAEGFERFVVRIGQGSHGMPVTINPGAVYLVDIKLGIPHGTVPGDYEGAIRILVKSGSSTAKLDIPALVAVTDQGNGIKNEDPKGNRQCDQSVNGAPGARDAPEQDGTEQIDAGSGTEPPASGSDDTTTTTTEGQAPAGQLLPDDSQTPRGHS
jgi:signal peptidase